MRAGKNARASRKGDRVSQYRRGADLERALVRQLRADGWVAARSASSKSCVDVWAVREGVVRLFQCSLRKTAAKQRAVKAAGLDIGYPIYLVTKGEPLEGWTA